MDSLGFSSHNHDHCISDAITRVERHCATAGLKLTETRRRVLEILLAEHRAMGAYDILERLRAEGRTAQPPVAYRALDFLVAHGFVHKIERLSAFVACAHPGQVHLPAFLICDVCAHVAEAQVDVPPGALRDMAKAADFDIGRVVLEATGTCPKCRTS